MSAEDVQIVREALAPHRNTSPLEQTRLDGCTALDRLAARLQEAEREQRKVPSAEGGPGHEERYWLKVKLNASIRHLRDIEDFYRPRGGTEDSFNMIRADRARNLYEQISDDFLNGKTTVPTMRERAEAAEAREAALREALPTDAELGRLKEHARGVCVPRPADQRWRQFGQHIWAIADRLERARAALGAKD